MPDVGEVSPSSTCRLTFKEKITWCYRVDDGDLVLIKDGPLGLASGCFDFVRRVSAVSVIMSV